MYLRTMKANDGKIFAYKDENNNEQLLGNILCLANNDPGTQYYEVDDPSIVPEEVVVENTDYNVE